MTGIKGDAAEVERLDDDLARRRLEREPLARWRQAAAHRRRRNRLAMGDQARGVPHLDHALFDEWFRDLQERALHRSYRNALVHREPDRDPRGVPDQLHPGGEGTVRKPGGEGRHPAIGRDLHGPSPPRLGGAEDRSLIFRGKDVKIGAPRDRLAAMGKSEARGPQRRVPITRLKRHRGCRGRHCGRRGSDK